MAARVRQRNRAPTGEDVMAIEPDMDFSSAGPHVPLIYRRSKDNKSDDEETLIQSIDVSCVISVTPIDGCYFFSANFIRNIFRVLIPMPAGSNGPESHYVGIFRQYVFCYFYICYRLVIFTYFIIFCIDYYIRMLIGYSIRVDRCHSTVIARKTCLIYITSSVLFCLLAF